MSDEITADDIREAADEIAAGGVQAMFVDGMNVSAIDPLKLLEVADRKSLQDAASTPVNSIFGNTVRLISPGAWQ